MTDSNIENKKVFTNKQVMMMLGGTISAVFALTSIYSKFMFNDEQLHINKQKIEDVNIERGLEIDELRGAMYRKVNEVSEEINGRIDRKADRISNEVKSNSEEIEQLQKDMLILKAKIENDK